MFFLSHLIVLSLKKECMIFVAPAPFA